MDYKQVAVFKERKLREENEKLKEKIKKLEEENFDLGVKVDFIKEKGTCGFCQYLDNEVIKQLKKQLVKKDKEIERLNDRLDKYISGRLKSMLEEKDKRIEELESQNDYECECNKDFVAYQNENERLKQIIHNAIYELEYSEYEHDALLDYLDITEEEYNKYKGE